MNISLDELKQQIKAKIGNIAFSPHFHDTVRKRPYLSESLVTDALNRFDSYIGFQIQHLKSEIRYKIALILSGRYNLVIVLEITNQGLNIITAWKTSKKWQKAIQR